MRFCVCIKQVPDVAAPVHTGRMVLNAYDASAVEEAIVLKEKHGGTVDLVLVGPSGATETIRKALAMGADDAYHIIAEDHDKLDSFAIASMLAGFFEGREYDVIACGKQAQDTDAGLTGPMLAEMKGLPYASNAVGLDIEGDRLVVTRQGDSGQEILVLSPPCLVTCSNDMNDPRIPNLRGIMAAKKKTIESLPMDQVGGNVSPRSQTIDVFDPPGREPGVMLDGEPNEMAGTLVNKLANEAKVI
ncbi:MAG: electron transfer flavoprotein subunit beta/FixA family protein [Rhodothermia bacterium]|nr:electron transfer flavoprotein subunit beta/FixA family protein [Rhodothermia bacterium]